MRVRTGYSFRAAIGHLQEVGSRLKECGWSVAPITDRCSTYGWVKWRKLCKELELRPIYGVELAVIDSFGKLPAVDYWTFLATDSVRPVNELIYLATQNPPFVPRPGAEKQQGLLYSQVRDQRGLVKIAGNRARLDEFSPEDAFVALSPSISRGFYREAKKKGHRFVASPDNFFPRREDRELYRVMLGEKADTQTYPQYIVSDEEWAFSLLHLDASPGDLEQALEMRKAIADTCVAEIGRANLLSPPKPKSLRQLCVDGATKLNVDLSNLVYAERMERELRLIAEKKFEDYFHILAEMIGWAKERMIVGPARGSSCGSLVCYLIGITAVDPIPFNLIFERFIDTTRSDLPDVDVDFSDARRFLVTEHLHDLYNEKDEAGRVISKRVARLGTTGSFQPRSAIQQAGKSLGVPQIMIDRACEQVIKRLMGDSRASSTIVDTLKDTQPGRELLSLYPEMEIAGRMEDHPTFAGQHAAGIVITAEPLSEFVAVDARTDSVMCDKYDAEELNLLKIDALGLTQLSVFERCLELVGLEARSEVLEKLPLDDPAAFKVLNDRHFSGVFQFVGSSMKGITEQIDIKDIEDVIAITALCRPGPTGGGQTDLWIKRRRGEATVSYPHPAFEPFLRDALGVVIYQEQVMQIGKEVGDLTWADVTALRKAMSKSLGKEYFDKYGDKWKSSAIAKGIPPEICEKFWNDMCQFGAWAFNRSHSVCYGIVSYWCLWLKAHHPVEFAAATLDVEQDQAKQIAILRELDEEGIRYVPVDPDVSTDRWEVKEEEVAGVKTKHLVGPLSSVHNVGPKTVAAILAARERFSEKLDEKIKEFRRKSGEDPTDEQMIKFSALARKSTGLAKIIEAKLRDPRTPIDSLWPIRDRVKKLYPELREIGIETTPSYVKDVQCGVMVPVVVIVVPKRIVPLSENEPVRVAKRGYEIKRGPTDALNLFVRDDTDEIFCKINRWKFEQMGRQVIEKGRPEKSIWAIKGTCPKDFRMIWVDKIKYLGDMQDLIDDDVIPF